jgi:hypothetical protein
MIRTRTCGRHPLLLGEKAYIGYDTRTQEYMLSLAFDDDVSHVAVPVLMRHLVVQDSKLLHNDDHPARAR